jgi:hypothetical protein
VTQAQVQAMAWWRLEDSEELTIGIYNECRAGCGKYRHRLVEKAWCDRVRPPVVQRNIVLLPCYAVRAVRKSIGVSIQVVQAMV